MSINFSAAATRRLAKLSPLMAAGLLAGGCVSSPTYGTGVSANEQLVTDVTSMVSLRPTRKEAIDYKPRAELVKPAPGQGADLPPPQEQVASATNPEWPESPEQRRKRLREDADANAENPSWRSSVINDVSGGGARARSNAGGQHAQESGIQPVGQAKAQREEVRKKLAESRQGSATQRRYLSEPPLEYRQPAATAAADELGEDEKKKERRAKKAAQVKGGIRDYIPWL